MLLGKHLHFLGFGSDSRYFVGIARFGSDTAKIHLHSYSSKVTFRKNIENSERNWYFAKGFQTYFCDSFVKIEKVKGKSVIF